MATKSEELRNDHSCLNKADADEPIFVLRAHDPLAAQTIRLWAAMAAGVHEDDKVTQALIDAEAAERWHEDRFASKKVCPDEGSDVPLPPTPRRRYATKRRSTRRNED